MIKLNAAQLRKFSPKENDIKKIRRNPIYLVLDRITDTYNVGSLFRLADAVAAEKIFLCGEMEYPPSSRIHKAAIGTEAWVPWEKRDSTLEIIKELKESRHPELALGTTIPKKIWNDKGAQIIAVEQAEKSISYKNITPKFPVAIVIGNESEGLEKEVVDQADIIAELPMYGINRSFNVWGSAAVVAYKVLEHL